MIVTIKVSTEFTNKKIKRYIGTLLFRYPQRVENAALRAAQEEEEEVRRAQLKREKR